MPVSSLLYVSRCTIAAGEADEAVRRIVETSRVYNPTVGLTGALVWTGPHFAQVLEGRVDAIDALMVRLRNDSRHDNILVVQYAPIARVRFADWSLAYRGRSQFVSNHVSRLLDNPSPIDRRRSVRGLIALMREFAKD